MSQVSTLTRFNDTIDCLIDRVFTPGKIHLQINLTKRPFAYTRTNMRGLLIVSAYFRHIEAFLPIFFVILEYENTTYAVYYALKKFK